MSPSPVRLLVAATALLAAVVGTATSAAAHHPTVSQPFSADSGDTCEYGSTQGTLAWTAVHLPEIPPVAVSGTVSDKPLPASPWPVCPDDDMFTIASFRAFAGNVLVDQETREVDNGTLAFSFRLAPSSAPVPHIERVDVQVCRKPLIHATRTAYCGKPEPHFPANVDGVTG
jgi:hypothetical protein